MAVVRKTDWRQHASYAEFGGNTNVQVTSDSRDGLFFQIFPERFHVSGSVETMQTAIRFAHDIERNASFSLAQGIPTVSSI
jgi:hypothetical protein